MRLQVFAARAGSAVLILASILAAAAIAGVRANAIAFPTGLSIMIPATILAALGLVGGAVWLWTAARHNTGYAKRLGLIALIGSAVFLYFPLSSVYYSLVLPPINDVSTDTDSPPHFVYLAKLRTPQMNPLAFDGQAMIHYRGQDHTIAFVLHELKNGELTRPNPRFFPHSDAPVKTLFWRCFETIKRLGWKIAAYDEKAGRIEATTTSPWFGRRFDAVLEVRPAGSGARVAVRAQSRSDKTDHGYAIRLVRRFLAANP